MNFLQLVLAAAVVGFAAAPAAASALIDGCPPLAALTTQTVELANFTYNNSSVFGGFTITFGPGYKLSGVSTNPPYSFNGSFTCSGASFFQARYVGSDGAIFDWVGTMLAFPGNPHVTANGFGWTETTPWKLFSFSLFPIPTILLQ